MTSIGKQVLLYLVDGRPGGLRTAEIANWTGHVVAAPRSDLATLLHRDEPHRTGVYTLLGEDAEAADTGGARVYIGEGDEVATRLKQHQANKDWWDRVVVVTSQAQAQQLTKSQVRYLESRLITRAKAAGRAVVENGTDPGFDKLSEAERSNMDFFLEQLDVLLPAIGVDVFRVVDVQPTSTASSPTGHSGVSPVFALSGKKAGLTARAQQVDGQFVVLEGSAAGSVTQSTTYSESTAKAYASIAAQHDDLLQKGVLVHDGAVMRFTKSWPFSSPSTAGSVVLGRSCNGRTEWKTADGISFGAWEGQGVQAFGAESDKA